MEVHLLEVFNLFAQKTKSINFFSQASYSGCLGGTVYLTGSSCFPCIDSVTFNGEVKNDTIVHGQSCILQRKKEHNRIIFSH